MEKPQVTNRLFQYVSILSHGHSRLGWFWGNPMTKRKPPTSHCLYVKMMTDHWMEWGKYYVQTKPKRCQEVSQEQWYDFQIMGTLNHGNLAIEKDTCWFKSGEKYALSFCEMDWPPIFCPGWSLDLCGVRRAKRELHPIAIAATWSFCEDV